MGNQSISLLSPVGTWDDNILQQSGAAGSTPGGNRRLELLLIDRIRDVGRFHGMFLSKPPAIN